MTSAEFYAARLRLGLTQAELGKIMGMSQPGIARLESGERQPTKIQSAFSTVLSLLPKKTLSTVKTRI